ncbi:MAG TPA: hypothetical protein VNZ45_08075 [Bacteroidia bacterium]|jgi:hypothetical protein|nr:hypothetical protein [Bacteroidia bacterium]
MTPSTLAAYIRWKGNVPTTTPWDNTTLLPIVNIAKDNIAAAIARRNPDYFGENSTAATVTAQEEYTKPADLMLFKRMDVSYTDTNAGSYKRARKVTLDELSSIPNSNLNDIGGDLGEDWFANFQPPSAPLVRFDDTGFFLYPIPGAQSATNVGAAFIRLWYVPKRVDLANLTESSIDIETTTEIGSVFHENIGDIVINQIKFKKGELTQQDTTNNINHILENLIVQSFREISTKNSSMPGDSWLQY